MTDQWNEELHCPQRRNSGVVCLSQPKHADMPTVDSIPDSFKAIHTEYGPNFHCGTYDVLVTRKAASITGLFRFLPFIVRPKRKVYPANKFRPDSARASAAYIPRRFAFGN
jgi:hypothetical protein